MKTIAPGLLESSSGPSALRLEGHCCRILLLWVWLCLLPDPAAGQGLVKFANTSTTLVSSFGNPISGPPGSFYFALLTAPVGTTDPTQFVFAGVYATNTATGGRIQGGSPLGGVACNSTWPPVTRRSFMVVGWPATEGTAWNPAWLFGGPIGMSMIATGMAGGTDPNTGDSYPALAMFGSTTINVGFNIVTCLGPYWLGIVLQPTNQTANAGDTVTFSVAAQACPPPYIQWYLNGSPIPGGADGTYRIASAQPAHAGEYFAVLSNPSWPIYSGTTHTSAWATLVVLTRPVITLHPQSDFVVLHTNFELHVQAAGPPPLYYQWFFGSSAIDNATNTSLVLTNFQASDVGTYTVFVTNTYGSITSCPALLTLMPDPPPLVGALSSDGTCTGGTQPANLRIRFGPCNGGYLQTTIFDTLLLTTNDIGQRFTVTAEDDANFAALVQILTNGTNDWVGYMLMAGPCGGGVCALERNFFQGLPVGGNGVDLQGYDITSFMLQLDQLAFTTYGVMTYTSARLRVFVNFQPHGSPFVSRQPCSETAETGSDVRFSLRTEGSPPLFYQWFFNGPDAITTATTDWILLLTNVQPAQAGAYTVVVTNAVGVVTSTPAMLSVIPPVPRRMVPALSLTGQPGSSLNLDFAVFIDSSPNWAPLDSVDMTNSSEWYFDVSAPPPQQRFYRAWQSGAPTMIPTIDLHMVPAITLTGSAGSSVRVDYINQFGPTDAWVTLATVTLTNTSQLYFDTSMIGQPSRLYRIYTLP